MPSFVSRLEKQNLLNFPSTVAEQFSLSGFSPDEVFGLLLDIESRLKGYLFLFAVALAVAFGLRWSLPSDKGLTLYMFRSTSFVSINIIGFWLSLGIVTALIVAKILWAWKH
jgi:hypothetical protein